MDDVSAALEGRTTNRESGSDIFPTKRRADWPPGLSDLPCSPLSLGRSMRTASRVRCETGSHIPRCFILKSFGTGILGGSLFTFRDFTPRI